MTTMPAAAASSTVPAETPSPRVETTDASDSGPRLLAITTSRPARRAVRAIACPSRPAPMIPTDVGITVARRIRTRTGSSPQGSDTAASDPTPAATSSSVGRWSKPYARWIARRSARSPERKTSGRSRATSRNPRAVHGPIPDTSVRVASTSSSVMRESASSLRRPSTNLSASARNVSPFRAEKPLSRSTCGSAASSSAGDGRCPPNRSCRCEMIARVEATDSCWPATWKTSVPKASSGGSSSIQARGRKSGRASISRASTGSAFRRNSRASRIGDRGSLAGWSLHAHAFSSVVTTVMPSARRSVSTISILGTVSSRAQSRWSSTASATQLIGRPPA